jgi:GAF domain-containing protein
MNTEARFDDDHDDQDDTDPRLAFVELSKIMLGDEHLNTTLRRIAELAKKTLPDIDEVSVTLVDGDQAKTVVFTGQLAVHLDERQYETGRGPCLDAAISGSTVAVDTRDSSGGYAEFARAAQRSGVNHSVSVGLPVPQRVVGALNLYAYTPDPIADETVSLAQTFATYAGVAVANAALYASTAELAEQMKAAMQTRSVIEQAKGILMARNSTTAERAFEMLREHSQRNGRKLSDVAAAIVESHLLLLPAPAPSDRSE